MCLHVSAARSRRAKLITLSTANLFLMSLLTRPTSRLPTYAEAVSTPAYIHEPIFLTLGRLILLIYVPGI